MTTLMLSAGEATRLGDLAPGGCKAMTVVGGRTMIDWWTELAGETPTVVCRSSHLAVIDDTVPTVVCDDGGGAARALNAGLTACKPDEPVTVVYADTFVSVVPNGSEWCAVDAAQGGRAWDIVEDGLVYYGDLPPEEMALVCVGLYRFAETDRLDVAVTHALAQADGEVGMADVVNFYGLPFVPVAGWQDVGDPEALARWRQPS